MPTRREVVAKNLTPQQLDAFARRGGFPSAAALNTMIRLGAYIQEGGKTTKEWIDRVARVYPNIPRSTIIEYAKRIHSVADLARVVGVDPRDAQTYVDNHIGNSYVTELDKGLDKRTPPHETPTHLKPHDGSLRALLEQQIPSEEQILKSMPRTQRRHALADLLDENLRDQHRSRAQTPTPDDRHFADRTRHDDVAVAYDQHTLMDHAESELSADDLDTLPSDTSQQGSQQ
jgi:hypothetical protein